jgi:hypothetical protein
MIVDSQVALEPDQLHGRTAHEAFDGVDFGRDRRQRSEQ